MHANGIKRMFKTAGLLGLLLVLIVPPAEAQTKNNRSFTLAGRQILLIERMTNSVLLAALEVDAVPRLRSIHWSRDRFDRMQQELRVGNPDLRLPPTTTPEILEALDRADLEWQRYDALFSEIMKTKNPSQAQVRALVASHVNAIEALREMVRTYKFYIRGGVDHSILSSTINGTGELRANTQLVLRGLMLAVQSNYAERERQLLAQFITEFDQILDGLMRGNPELRLLAAPNAEIKDELTAVDLQWRKVRPVLESAASGETVTKDQIAAVAQQANDMAVPLTKALIMYLSI